MSKEKTKPPPRCKAILLCHRVIRDTVTGQRSLIDVLETIAFQRLPDRTPGLQLYLQLIDGTGPYEIGFEIRHLDRDATLSKKKLGTIDFANRLQRVHLIITVPPLLLHDQGDYDLIVFANDEEIDRQHFTVKVKQE